MSTWDASESGCCKKRCSEHKDALFFQISVSGSSDKFPKVKSLGQKGVPFLIFFNF